MGTSGYAKGQVSNFGVLNDELDATLTYTTILRIQVYTNVQGYNVRPIL